MHTISRRNALKVIGPGAALLAPIVRASRAEAQAPAKRILFWFHPHGVVRSAFWPQGTETAFTLGSTLKPIEPWKASMIVVGGLGFTGQHGGGGSIGTAGGGHQGTGSLLTGLENTAKDGLATHANISADQVIANKMTTPFKSLLLSAWDSSGPGIRDLNGMASTRHLSAAGPGKCLIPEIDPQKAFDNIFGRVAVSTGGGGGAPDPAAEMLRAQKKSILDYLTKDLTRLQSRLGARDKVKIDQHLGAIRELEMQLSGASIQASGACMVPGRPGTLDPFANANFQMIQKLQTNAMVQAMACGLTRVGVLTWAGGQSAIKFDWLGLTADHHDLGHGNKTEAIDLWFFQRLADMLTQMQNIREGAGTMLDNTIVVTISDMGDGNHNLKGMPFVVIAGKNTGLRTGRYLNYPAGPPNPLFASLIQIMGGNTADWGKAAIGTLPNLT